MKPILYALPMLALTACGQDNPRQSTSSDRDASVTVPIAQPTAKTPPIKPDGQAPEPAKPRFAGLWAVDTAACKSPPWNFSERDLTTKGEVYCSFKRVDPVDKGYDIDAVCSVAGDALSETMRLRFSRAGKVMTVSSDQTYKPIDLVRCDGAV